MSKAGIELYVDNGGFQQYPALHPEYVTRSIPPLLRMAREEIWQMKIRPKVEKRWHSPFLQGSGKFWDPQWRPLPGKNRHYSFPQPFGVPSLATSLSNVVCDSSRAKYVMVGQRFVTEVSPNVICWSYQGVITPSVMHIPHCHYLII